LRRSPLETVRWTVSPADGGRGSPTRAHGGRRAQADAAKGLISFRAPLAQAVLGAHAGDMIEAKEPLGHIMVLGATDGPPF